QAREESHQSAVRICQVAVGGQFGEVLHVPVAHHIGEVLILDESENERDPNDHPPASQPRLDDDPPWRRRDAPFWHGYGPSGILQHQAFRLGTVVPLSTWNQRASGAESSTPPVGSSTSSLRTGSAPAPSGP